MQATLQELVLTRVGGSTENQLVWQNFHEEESDNMVMWQLPMQKE